MYTLGIETSCDETAAAVLRDDKVLSSIVSALTHGLPEVERQEIVRAALAGNGGDERLSGMVEH